MTGEGSCHVKACVKHTYFEVSAIFPCGRRLPCSSNNFPRDQVETDKIFNRGNFAYGTVVI